MTARLRTPAQSRADCRGTSAMSKAARLAAAKVRAVNKAILPTGASPSRSVGTWKNQP